MNGAADMNLTVNGKLLNFEKTTILQLIEHYNLKPESVVVEKNGTIVQRDQYGKENLIDGDVLEIVRFVGGG